MASFSFGRSRQVMLVLWFLLFGAGKISALPPEEAESFAVAEKNGVLVEEIFRRTRKMMHAWLAHADPKTLLLPDRIPGYTRGRWEPKAIYRVENSAAPLLGFEA